MVRVFDEDNLQYFSEICTPHKDHIGGKGIGRLSFIKYGNSVQVSSQLPSTLVTFDYTPEFSPSNAYKAAKSGDPWTTILISEPKQEVYTQVAKLGRVDKRDSQTGRVLIQGCSLGSSHGPWGLVRCGMGTDRTAFAI